MYDTGKLEPLQKVRGNESYFDSCVDDDRKVRMLQLDVSNCTPGPTALSEGKAP